MSQALQTAITRQRVLLRELLVAPLAGLAGDCRELWPDRAALEARLIAGLSALSYCKYLYVLDADACQITANITRSGPLAEHVGRDRAHRPYMAEALSGKPFSLSQAYISRTAHRPSLTAVQRITDAAGKLLGYLGADFDLRELPHTQELHQQPEQWVQLKGDPAIRAGLFQQQRVASPMDARIDKVLDLVTELIAVHGVYHGKLHFSSSRATLWLLDDPYRYRIHDIEDLTDPDMCLTYPRRPYSDHAIVPLDQVRRVFACFHGLRFMDEIIYLRSGSLNIFNGLVGLNFSCDGSHYMPWNVFLDKGVGFWLGTGAEETPAPQSEEERADACRLS